MSSKHSNPLSSIDAELAERLQTDDAFMRRYIRFWAQTEVASEIRALRKARRMRQAEVARLAETGQPAISKIEKADNDSWTFKTLISIAEVLRARLRITFEPIEDVAAGYRASSQDVQVQFMTDSTGKKAGMSSGGGTYAALAFASGDSGDSSGRTVEM